MPGARMLLEELIRKKRDEGEDELADKLVPVLERLSFSQWEQLPAEVDAIYAAHYAGEPLSEFYSRPKLLRPH